MNRFSCCCDTGCPIGSDTFPTDGSGAPSGWTLRDGSVDVVGGQLEFTAADSLVLFSTGHPDNIASAVVTVDVIWGGLEEARIVVGHDGSDDDNYYFCQATPYELSLYELVSGTPNLLACVPHDGSVPTVTVYFDGATTGRFAATCGVAFVETDGVSSTGKYVGLGIGALEAVLDYDNFVFAKHKQEGNSCSEFAPDDCDLGSDNFDRADDADPGCGWTEQAGTSAISGTALAFTASNSRARFNQSNPDNGAMSVSVDYTSTHDNNTAEIGVGANSAGSTRFYCRITSGASKTFLIGSTAAGTLATTTITTTSGDTYAVTVTLDDARLCASITGVTGASLIVPVTMPTGECWATLGTVGVAGGSVSFDNFELTRAKHEDSPACALCGAIGPDCSTDCCPEDHNQMIVNVAAGLTDKSTCAWCSQLVGEFVCTGGPCDYSYCQHQAEESPCLCAQYECDDDCDDGGFPASGPGTQGCHSGDSTASPPTCNGVSVSVRIIVDDDNTCYLKATLSVSNMVSPLDDSPCLLPIPTVLAEATYETPIGTNVVPCSGQTYTLERYDGALSCSGTHRNAGFFPPYTGGCNGTFPDTITVRSAP